MYNIDVSVSKSYPARCLLREIVLQTDLVLPGIGYARFLFIGRFVLFYICKVLVDLNDGDPSGSALLLWYNLVIIVCEIVIFLFVIRINHMFLALGILDFQRKKRIATVLGSLLNPSKNRNEPYAAVFPTLNVADQKTMTSWLNMRLQLFDYGKKQTTRV